MYCLEVIQVNVVEEAIHLLSSYLWGPYEILEEHKLDLPQKFKKDILYLINEHE